MVVMYNVLGRQVGSHWLAMATLATVFGGASLATGGKKAKDANQGPPINASSPDEEKFIKEFMANIEKEEKQGAKH